MEWCDIGRSTENFPEDDNVSLLERKSQRKDPGPKQVMGCLNLNMAEK